jgi:hypothetical protein
MTAEPANIQTALAAVMGELPAIGKERHQGDGIQYAYRGIEQVTREVQGLFAKHGVVVVPLVDHVDVREIVVNGKPWTDTTLGVTYTLTGPDGSSLTARTVGIGRDNSDKGANKAMTQAFKYLLLQVLCISDAKDDADGQTHVADGQKAPRKAVGSAAQPAPNPDRAAGNVNALDRPTPAQIRMAGALFNGRGWTEAERHQKTAELVGHPITSWNDMSRAEFTTMLDKLKAMP